MHENWIPFADGEYLVDKAYLIGSHDSALLLADAIIEVYSDAGGRRYLKGRARVNNLRVIELMETGDRLDMILDLGAEFKFALSQPVIQAGKFFVPEAKSALRFSPREPWRQLSVDDYAQRIAKLTLLPE